MDQQQHVPASEYDVEVNPAIGRLVFGWLLVGAPLAYGVITTLSRVGQLFT